MNLNASGSSDPDSDPLTFTWTGPFSEGGGTVTGETVQVTVPLGTHTIDLLVEDSQGGTDTDFIVIQVVDTTPPVITLTGSSAVTVEVGSLYDASMDAGATASDTVDGDLTGSIVTGGLPVNTSAPGTFQVTYNVTDQSDNAAVQVARTVTVVNTPPILANLTLSSATINENDTVTLNGDFIDPTIGDIHTVRINWGDGEPNTVLTLVSGLRSFEATYQYLDDVPTTTPTDVNVIQVTVEDSAAGIGTNATNVTVTNVSPTVGVINATIDPVEVGTLVNASAFFTDPGTLDTHTAVFDWGDGTTSAGAVNPGTREVRGDHTYVTPGVYAITLTVTDDDGSSSQSIFQFIVAYDPEAGFVTGGGFIDSPEEAYQPDQTLVGKAKFGFVSKYKKGATTPTGQTEFNFKVADLNFHSGSYDWLVVAGHKAMYKGTGTINGEGNYGFLLSAIDAALTPSSDIDKFRIKIWDKDNADALIYDNQVGAGDNEDPTTDIGGGSIVIHKGK